MADDVATEALRAAERALQRAQLAGDADALDLQRSGGQTMNRVEEEELAVLVDGATGVTWFLGTLEGVFKDEPFVARVRYTRTWIQDDAGRWRLLAAHVSGA